MEIEYSATEVEEFIKKYYKEKRQQDVEIIITPKQSHVGIYESLECITTITILSKISLLGKETTMKETLSREDIEKIFTELLEDTEYKLTYLNYKEGLDNSCSGYGMCEKTTYKPYFTGINIGVIKKKENVRRMVK